jgi:hypothetical protein
MAAISNGAKLRRLLCSIERFGGLFDTKRQVADECPHRDETKVRSHPGLRDGHWPETRDPSLIRLCLIAACGGHRADPGEKPDPVMTFRMKIGD